MCHIFLTNSTRSYLSCLLLDSCKYKWHCTKAKKKLALLKKIFITGPPTIPTLWDSCRLTWTRIAGYDPRRWWCSRRRDVCHTPVQSHPTECPTVSEKPHKNKHSFILIFFILVFTQGLRFEFTRRTIQRNYRTQYTAQKDNTYFS